MDKLYTQMSSLKNLELAWMRIKTGQNIQYKNYYRELIVAYELCAHDNLKRLHERLSGGSYQPNDVLRFYIPKASGLHRPITFLYVDDLIIFQSIANIVAKKFTKHRKEVEFNNVFSNTLNRKPTANIFFLNKWQNGYGKFLKKIKAYFKDGNVWVAHFDLAAYYDTICHETLAKQISPRQAYTDFTDFTKKCLNKWSSDKTRKINHGIPQGPMASNFLAEIFMLPIDKSLNRNNTKYVRYVDDIKIYGKTKEEVLEGVIRLEFECKDRGLIPQSKKFEIIKASNIEEAIGKNPSITSVEKNNVTSDINETYRMLIKSFDDKTFDISKIRYILKTSGKNKKILDFILENIHNYNELVDEFIIFLSNYFDDLSVGRKVYKLCCRGRTIHGYVEGKYWWYISNFNFTKYEKKPIKRIAIEKLIKFRRKDSLKLGLYKFLCSTNDALITKFLDKESSSLLQAFVVPNIPIRHITEIECLNLLNSFLARSSYEPALAALKEIIYIGKTDLLSRITVPSDNSGVLYNTIGKPEEIDSVGQIIKYRFDVPYSIKWRKLLDNEYDHANKILFLADNAYYMERNTWMNFTDSFNDTIIRKFIDILNLKQTHIGWPKTIGTDGKAIGLGVLLDRRNRLSRNYAGVMDGFRVLHERRNKAPSSHAYDKKTLQQTKPLTGKEQRNLYKNLKTSYSLLIQELSILL